jgi:endonuclease/exonuclease/phosphatase family metal-dependent hydrolase
MTGAPSGRYERIARELGRLDPDFAFLQEGWTRKARKSAPGDGCWCIARAAGQHTFFQQSGLVTLSKFPIVGGEFYPFSHAAFPDRIVNKGVLKVSVRLPAGDILNVWNVHFQDGGSAKVRISQVREFLALVEKANDGQVADLVGGDFNCTPDSALYRELEGVLGPCVQEMNGREPFVTWDDFCRGHNGGETLDYIFLRGRTVVPLVTSAPCPVFAGHTQSERLSDHLGVEAEVSLAPATALAGNVGNSISSELTPEAYSEQAAYVPGE